MLSSDSDSDDRCMSLSTNKVNSFHKSTDVLIYFIVYRMQISKVGVCLATEDTN